MKISILTHPLGVNYGGILQAYALSTFLQRQGHIVNVLNRQHDMPFIKRVMKTCLIALHHPRYYQKRYEHLQNFVRRYIPYTKPLYTSAQMKRFVLKNKSNVVIVGSDQVWRADFSMGYGFDYFLDFVPDNIKKISYAASFGLNEWKYTNKQTLKIKKLINNYTAVSVREDEGIILCMDNLGIKAEHVLDPTMLLEAKDYESIITPRIVKEDYVFVYWLGNKEDKQKSIIEANVFDKKIVDISLRGDEPLMSIEDWLSYIKYADKIITDSFHGCVFSILFKKQFTICANKSGGNGRLHSLFKMLGIYNTTDSIDYSTIDSKLNSWRNLSYTFIKQSLQQ